MSARGHELTVTGDFSNQMGGGQDGSAAPVPEPHPYFKN
jgi:hypothetical protein